MTRKIQLGNRPPVVRRGRLRGFETPPDYPHALSDSSTRIPLSLSDRPDPRATATLRSLKDVAMNPLCHDPGAGPINWHPNDAGMQGYAVLFWDAIGPEVEGEQRVRPIL